MSEIILEMKGVSKRFGAVQALKRVNLSVQKGTVHALIGENGAGKSTLVKILSGSLVLDEGEIIFNGAPYRIHTPKEARMRGISMIYQELTLAPHLTVAENVTLGIEKQRYGITQNQDKPVREALRLLGYSHLDLSKKVSKLGVGEQQIVEISRTLLTNARLVIMDEPTNPLSADDTRALFRAIKKLRDEGVTIIYISHFLEEVMEIADAYTVLRDGETVATGSVADTTITDLVTHMVGRSLQEMFPRVPHKKGEVLLKAEHVNNPQDVVDVSFSLHSGEIMGIAGLVGAGRTETLRSLFGLDSAKNGKLTIKNKVLDLSFGHSASQSLKSGMSMVSEDRKNEGLAIRLPIRDNITLSSLSRLKKGVGGIIDFDKERQEISRQKDYLSIKYKSIMDPCSSLSGGNQQKVALARVLLDGSDVLLLDEPTRGIDVKSKVEVYNLIGQFAASGKGIILVSSYLPELFGVCDTLAVMHRGSLSPVLPIEEWTEGSVMAWATTGKSSSGDINNDHGVS